MCFYNIVIDQLRIALIPSYFAIIPSMKSIAHEAFHQKRMSRFTSKKIWKLLSENHKSGSLKIAKKNTSNNFTELIGKLLAQFPFFLSSTCV